MGSTLRTVKGSELTHQELDDNFADSFSQTGHGLSVGDAVYLDGSGDWQQAQANAATTLADGIVVAVPDANTVVVYSSRGVVDITHGLGAAGQVAYLSQGSAGALTTTAPTSGLIQRVGKTVATGKLLWAPGATEEV